MEITIDDFERPDLRVGTVVAVELNRRARHPAYKVTVDLGPEIGRRTSSAQITDLYRPEELVGSRVICCVNLPVMHIGSVRSEVRILGCDTPEGCVLLRPERLVDNGTRIF